MFISLFGIVTPYVGWKVVNDPDNIFFISEENAKWIRFREPTRLKAIGDEKLVTIFRTNFQLDSSAKDSKIYFKVFREASFWIDNVLIFKTSDGNPQWKATRVFMLGRPLEKGMHTLQVKVESQNSHPSLLLYSKDLNLTSGEWWKATIDGKVWEETLEAAHIIPHPISRMFDRVDKAFFSNIYLFVSVFFFGFFIVLANEKGLLPAFIKSTYLSPSSFRYMMIIAWSILCFRNILTIPLEMGMDFKGHLVYILTVAREFYIPYATEGWQMFQPPFYYLVSAGLFKCLAYIVPFETATNLLRIIPLICGALQIEVCYRVMKLMYPKNKTVQILGTIVGGFIPMNVYLSQVIGNEPLAGIFSSTLVLWQIKYIRAEEPPSREQLIIAGFVAGLALLTKTSAILIIMLVIFSIIFKAFFEMGRQVNQLIETSKSIAVILMTAFLVCGWYYIRNIIEIGVPFMGGWDGARKIIWWQDPGFRTIEQFTTFGESLLYPVFSSVVSVWDSLYSSIWMDGFLSDYNLAPWNYSFMLSLVWLSIPLTLFMIIGLFIIAIDIKNSYQDGRLFCVISIFFYLFAILYLFLSLPILSTGKATYALGLLPCIAVVFAEGVRLFLKIPVLNSIIAGIIAVWVVCSYCSFFVVETGRFMSF